jgi:hypothetical protein
MHSDRRLAIPSRTPLETRFKLRWWVSEVGLQNATQANTHAPLRGGGGEGKHIDMGINRVWRIEAQAREIRSFSSQKDVHQEIKW